VTSPDNIALNLVFAAIFFYVLYGVVRAAVRDGIGQAEDRRRQRSDSGGSGQPGEYR
jgi:hypothetical protein